MSNVIPADTHAAGDSGHVTDHNNISDVLGLLAQAATQMAGAVASSPPGGNSANITALQSFASSGTGIAAGLRFLSAAPGTAFGSNAGTITATTINSAISAGYQGLFLDPRFVWDASGLVINGIKNFLIESRMVGSIGWNGAISYNTSGYIKTDTGAPADGIQVYASSPATSPTQGIIFKNCVMVGANPNTPFHLGGGQRRCGLVDCLVYNTASASTTVAAGSNGVAVSTFAGAGTLNVAATTGFPTSGTLVVATSTTAAVISYTGTTSTTFTGCTTTAGTGNLATSGSVQLAAFGVINDTGLSDNNSEDNIFSFTGGGGIAGAFGALGLGIGNQTQNPNDTGYYEMTTAGGQYGIVKTGGGNHTFTNWYDRSNAATATVWNHGGGRLNFIGGEHRNSNGLSHLVDNSSSITTLTNAMVTQAGAPTTTCQVTAGSLVFRGASTFSLAQTLAISGTGTVDMTDPAVNAANASISGSAGTLALATSFAGNGGAPTVSGWTGAVVYQGPAIVASGHGAAATTTQTVTWNRPLDSQTHRFRVAVMIRPTVAGTSTVPNISFTQEGGAVVSQPIPMWQLNGAATAPSYTCAATGTFVGHMESETNNGSANVVVAITPTGSTFDWSAEITQLS